MFPSSNLSYSKFSKILQHPRTSLSSSSQFSSSLITFPSLYYSTTTPCSVSPLTQVANQLCTSRDISSRILNSSSVSFSTSSSSSSHSSVASSSSLFSAQPTPSSSNSLTPAQERIILSAIASSNIPSVTTTHHDNTTTLSLGSLSLITRTTATSMSGITVPIIQDIDTLETLYNKVNVLKDTKKPWGTVLVLSVLQRVCQLYTTTSLSFVSTNKVSHDHEHYVQSILRCISWELGRRKIDNTIHTKEPSSANDSLFIGLTPDQYVQLLDYLNTLKNYNTTILDDTIHTSAANAFLLTTSNGKLLQNTSTRTLVSILENGQKLYSNTKVLSSTSTISSIESIVHTLCQQTITDSPFILTPIPSTISYWSNHRNTAISYVRIVAELIQRLEQSNYESSTNIASSSTSASKKRKRSWKISQLASLLDTAALVIQNEFYAEAVRIHNQSSDRITASLNDASLLYQLPTIKHSQLLLHHIIQRSIGSFGLEHVQRIIEGYWKGKATMVSANPSGNTSASSASDHELSVTQPISSTGSNTTSLPFHGTKDSPVAMAYDWIPKYLHTFSIILYYRLYSNTLSIDMLQQGFTQLLHVIRIHYDGVLTTGKYSTHHVLLAKEVQKQRKSQALLSEGGYEGDDDSIIIATPPSIHKANIDWIAVRALLSSTEGMNMGDSLSNISDVIHPKYAAMITAMEHSTGILSHLNQSLYYIRNNNVSLTPTNFEDTIATLLQSITYTPYILCPGEPELYFTRSKWTALRSLQILKPIYNSITYYYPTAWQWLQSIPDNKLAGKNNTTDEIAPWKRNEIPLLLTLQMYTMAALVTENPVHDRLTVRTRSIPNANKGMNNDSASSSPMYATTIMEPTPCTVWTDTLLEDYSLFLQCCLQLGISPQLPIPKNNRHTNKIIMDPLEYKDAMMTVRELYYRYGMDSYAQVVQDSEYTKENTFLNSLEFTYAPFITVIASRLHRRLENLRIYVGKQTGGGSTQSMIPGNTGEKGELNAYGTGSSSSVPDDLHRRVRVLKSKLQHKQQQQYYDGSQKRNYSIARTFILYPERYVCAYFSTATNSKSPPLGKSSIYLSSTTTNAILNTVITLLRQISQLYRSQTKVTETTKTTTTESIQLCIQQLSLVLNKWRSFAPSPASYSSKFTSSSGSTSSSTVSSFQFLTLYLQSLREKIQSTVIHKSPVSISIGMASIPNITILSSYLLDTFRALETLFPSSSLSSKLPSIYQDIVYFGSAIFEYLQTESISLTHEEIMELLSPLCMYILKYGTEIVLHPAIANNLTILGEILIRCLWIYLHYIEKDYSQLPNI